MSFIQRLARLKSRFLAVAVAGGIGVGLVGPNGISSIAPSVDAASTSAYANAVLSHSPLAYWRMDTTTGTMVADTSGHGYSGTTQGGVQLGAPGALAADTNPAMTFDGSTGFVRTSASLTVGDDFSMEAWVKANSSSSRGVVASLYNGGHTRTLFLNGQQFLGMNDVGSAWPQSTVTSTTVNPGVWHHVVYTVQGGTTLQIYIDGALTGSANAPVSTGFSANAIIGSSDAGWLPKFGGSLDEVAVYSSTLSASAVKADFQAGSAPPAATPTPTATRTGTPTATPTRPPAVNCSTSLQSQIDAAPAGSIVTAPACIYREAVTVTKPLTLAGASGAEIRGSDVWNAWTANGATWSSQQTVPALADSSNVDWRCPDNTHPRCTLAEQVFFDGQPLMILGIGVTPAAGQFALDSARHVVLGNNPSGHTVEVTTRQSWIRTTADGVTIQNFTMRHAGNDANIGAVSNDGHSNWSLQDSTLSDSHGPGVGMSQGQNVKVLRNEIRRGGNLGLAGDSFNQGLVQGNHIHDNNTDGFARSWGAAGMKTSLAHGLTVDSNEIDHNQADGLWCDVACQSVTYSNNRVHDNLGQGILFEVSDGGSIHDNVTWNNGWDGGVPGGYWIWHGGIVLSTSANVEVYNNTVAWNAEGISVIHQNRSGTPTPPAPTGINIHDNVIVKQGVSNANYWANMSLAWSDENNSGPQSMYDPAANNHAANNRYWYDQPADPNTARFFWIWGYSVLDNYVKNSPTTGDRYLTDAEMSHALTAAKVPLTAPAH